MCRLRRRGLSRRVDRVENTVLRKRGFVAFVCFAVLIAVAMAPLGSDSFSAILVPLEPLFGTVESEPIADSAPSDLPLSPIVSTLASRAPPSATR